MGISYNVYCDESCHLENDGIRVMTIGSIWCATEKVPEISARIREIKMRNGVKPEAEIKWTKVAPVKKQLYEDIVNYFFDDDDLHFRCVVIPDKSILNHEKFNQTHDDWYYKMYFTMLKTVFSPLDNYYVYIDVKDRYSNIKAQNLHKVCCNNALDFSRLIIRRIQPVRSNEIQIMQLADILIGSITYKNRVYYGEVLDSRSKYEIVELVSDRSKYSLTKTTLNKENKLNILVWHPTAREE